MERTRLQVDRQFQPEPECRISPEYRFRKGNLILVPYHPEVGVYREDTLVHLYTRLKTDGLFDTVFHENPRLTLASFINLFTQQTTLLQIVGKVEDEAIGDIIGLAWLSDVRKCDGMLTRGIASFVAFKEYQRPRYTDPAGDLVLDFWFEQLDIDVVVGMTPVANRAALRYIRRLGFLECGRIPGFTTLHGEPCDAVISYMSR